MGGLAYMTGPTGRPLRAGASVTDIVGGSYGVIGILAALYQRQATGQGQLIQASLFESVAFLVAQHMAIAAITGKPAPPMPDRGRTWSVYDLFTTADGELVFVGVTSDRHWQRMCETFGYADLAADRRLDTNQGRIEQRAWFLPESKARPEDLFEDPHLNQSGSLALTRLPGGGTGKLPKIPLRMDGRAFDLRLDPPAIGEGSVGLYREIGLSAEDIRRLAAEGVIELPRDELSAVG
jgi:crotonobetainyl-CoA:carnitine CoA-transferase CaiB-like acyl-CoA transferase